MPGIYTKPAVKGIHYLKLHLPLKASTMQTEVTGIQYLGNCSRNVV